jgi:hypothetical protein
VAPLSRSLQIVLKHGVKLLAHVDDAFGHALHLDEPVEVTSGGSELAAASPVGQIGTHHSLYNTGFPKMALARRAPLSIQLPRVRHTVSEVPYRDEIALTALAGSSTSVG